MFGAVKATQTNKKNICVAKVTPCHPVTLCAPSLSRLGHNLRRAVSGPIRSGLLTVYAAKQLD